MFVQGVREKCVLFGLKSSYHLQTMKIILKNKYSEKKIHFERNKIYIFFKIYMVEGVCARSIASAAHHLVPSAMPSKKKGEREKESIIHNHMYVKMNVFEDILI